MKRLGNFAYAVAGLGLAVLGGMIDLRGALVVGSVDAVFGLTVWVLLSGSSAFGK